MIAVLPGGSSSPALESHGGGPTIALRPGETLLDATLKAGITRPFPCRSRAVLVPFSCRSADCGACELRITARRDHARLTGRCRSHLP